MIGLTSLRTNGPPPEAPDLKHRRALRVLEKIDEILERERRTESERDTQFIECDHRRIGKTGRVPLKS